ncbi:MAG: NYN domain-containing protein [Deltaproteobacteria bacterium]|nr:NYN domain-containing protein [Deltaproteobacteria bacterium]
MRRFIAVYIDLENVSGILDLDTMLQDIILEENKGDSEEYIFAVKFACGHTHAISKVREQLVNYNFEIREAPHVTGKKNRADLIISLDAFEKLYLEKPSIDRFVFVTRDSDFSVIMDILRKHGKEVWLITQEGDEQRPIFMNCTDNIIVIPHTKASRLIKKQGERKLDLTPLGAKDTGENRKGEDEKTRDKIAEELFVKVVIRLDPSEEHLLNGIANKMRLLDKSFKIKNTGYKKMNILAKEFEKKGWFKTKKNKDGHLMVKDLEIGV